MVNGNFYANSSRFFFLVFIFFIFRCEMKMWEYNIGIGNSVERKRFKFHMNLYETWIYYDFPAPQLLATLRLFSALKGKKKIFKLFSRRSWSESRGDWLYQALNVPCLLEMKINFKESLFTGGSPVSMKILHELFMPARDQSFNKKAAATTTLFYD